jgi:hypothetical protein
MSGEHSYGRPELKAALDGAFAEQMKVLFSQLCNVTTGLPKPDPKLALCDGTAGSACGVRDRKQVDWMITPRADATSTATPPSARLVPCAAAHRLWLEARANCDLQ